MSSENPEQSPTPSDERASEQMDEPSINSTEQRSSENEPTIELKYGDVYKSEDWKQLDPIDRAQILLVGEGAKSGSIVGADYTHSQKIFKELGLVEEQTSEPGELNPVFMITTPEKMSTYQREILMVPEGLSDLDIQREFWKIQGKALGYPACCTEEYANPQKNLDARKAISTDPNRPISNYEYTLQQKIARGEKIPEDLLYKPPTFTPCSVDCQNAHEKLQEWRKVTNYADPEAARELREFNIAAYQEMQEVFPDEFKAIQQKEEDKMRLESLRDSIHSELGSVSKKRTTSDIEKSPSMTDDEVRRVKPELDKLWEKSERARQEKLLESLAGREGEPWLAQYRERAYDGVLEEFNKSIEAGVPAGTHLYQVLEYGMIDSPFRRRFQKILSEKDFENIHFATVTSFTASEIAGKKITRGVFLVSDDEVYKKLEKVFGESEGNTHGVVIRGRLFNDLPHYRDAGIILSKDNDKVLGHEVRHTIDPHLVGNDHTERKGNDRILEEAFAEYQNLVVAKKDWQGYEEFLHLYRESYAKDEPSPDEQSWKEMVHEIAVKAKSLHQKYGAIEVQRRMLQSKTIEAFLQQE